MPFHNIVLPRRSRRRGWPISNAHCPKATDEDVTVDGVAITNDVLLHYVPTIGLGELARNHIISDYICSRLYVAPSETDYGISVTLKRS